MIPLVVIFALGSATTAFAWGASRFADDERAWMRIVGSLAMGIGAFGFAGAVVMVLQ